VSRAPSLLQRLVPTREFKTLLENITSPLEEAEGVAKLPLAALLGLIGEQHGRTPLLRPAISWRSDLAETLSVCSRNNEPLWLILDSVEEDLSFFPTRITLVGSSLSEILKSSNEQKLSVESLLQNLKSRGVDELASSSRTGIERLALEMGFRLNISFDASSLIDHLHLATGPKDFGERTEDSTLLLERFAGELIELRDELEGFENWRCEICLRSEDARRMTLQSPFAAILTRGIALSRLLLPSNVGIETPSSLLGKHLSRLLFLLNISSPGIVALDATTAAKLGVPLRSEFLTLKER